ncbi:MAG: hypothetical protein JO225_16735, partial [Candidatus Eremiobacteraeota bacterium]|nr:hypothetical protein [Candidatus Eremiobacteraeota bacterium]
MLHLALLLGLDLHVFTAASISPDGTRVVAVDTVETANGVAAPPPTIVLLGRDGRTI